MNIQNLLTIVIPCKNEENYIGHLILVKTNADLKSWVISGCCGI
jgi:glycosyltransferase involved in cell wall biosynthesis